MKDDTSEDREDGPRENKGNDPGPVLSVLLRRMGRTLSEEGVRIDPDPDDDEGTPNSGLKKASGNDPRRKRQPLAEW